jgi:hypothetical protein
MANLRDILLRIQGELTHNDESAERIFLPDLFTFVDNALTTFLDEVVFKEETRKDLLLSTFDITLTANPATNIYTGSLATAKSNGLRQQPPWRNVSLPGFSNLLYTPFIPNAENPRATASVSFYSTRGDTLFVETLETVTLGTTAVTLQAYKYPVVDTLIGTLTIPKELESDFVTFITDLLSKRKQQGVRI